MKKTKKTKKSLNNQIKIIDKTQKKLYNNNTFGDMAQLVERLVRNEEASGSNPLISTIKRRLCRKDCINAVCFFV